MYKFIVALFVVALPVLVSAHVSVKPAEVGVGAWQIFSVGVPVERDLPTIGVRLVIPEGLEHVSPNVKPGWTVEMVTEGEGDEKVVREIIWTGGSIPEGMRDDFLFNAHVPPLEGVLLWKAYQTYEDGTVVAWDASEEEQPKDESGADDFSVRGPYSETKIVNDLVEEEPVPEPVVAAPIEAQNEMKTDKGMYGYGCDILPLAISVLALLFSLAIALTVWRKPESNQTFTP